jgi:putative hydrolase of the HAD superfamily
VRRLAELDAVTFDANGTLIELVDPVPKLVETLREHGVERAPELVAKGFAEEARFYVPRTIEGRDNATLAVLREQCARVFLTAVEAELVAAEFAPAYVAAIEFRVLPGVPAALRSLRRRGLELAVVGNWDATLAERLAETGLDEYFGPIVSAAEAGAAKPDPRIFELALSRLGVDAGRALHVGDGSVDEDGARAAGMHFEWTPLPSALSRLQA